ncbi:MAG: cyclic nucleotide-binding domain-containing protein [Pirellulaceae bacterium]
MRDSTEKPSDTDAWKLVAALNGLDEATVAKLKSLGTVKSFQEGTILFNESEQHAQLYFVCHGNFRLEMVTQACGMQTILSVGVGELLAWSALIGDRSMTATATAMQDSAAIVFDAASLKAALDADVVLGYAVMQAVARALSRRLLATRLQLLDLYGR